MKLNIFIEKLKTIEDSLIKTEYDLKDYEVTIDYWFGTTEDIVKNVTADHNKKQITISNLTNKKTNLQSKYVTRS